MRKMAKSLGYVFDQIDVMRGYRGPSHFAGWPSFADPPFAVAPGGPGSPSLTTGRALRNPPELARHSQDSPKSPHSSPAETPPPRDPKA